MSKDFVIGGSDCGCSANTRCNSGIMLLSDSVPRFFTVPFSSNSTNKFVALQNGISSTPESVRPLNAKDEVSQRPQKNHGDDTPVLIPLKALNTSSRVDLPTVIVLGSGGLAISPAGPAVRFCVG